MNRLLFGKGLADLMIKKCKDKIWQWLRNRPEASLGIAIDEYRAYMVAVQENSQGCLELQWQDMVELDASGWMQNEVVSGNTTKYDDLMELSIQKIGQNFTENIICSMVLEESEVFYYEKFFPEMNCRELEQAVRLDFAAAAAWQEKFYCSYQSTGQGMLRIAGIQKRKLEEHLQALRQEYPWSQAVLACQDELADASIQELYKQGTGNADGRETCWAQEHKARMQAAIYAAVCGLRNRGIVFRPYGEYLCKWNWLHVSQAMWGTAMIAVAMLWGIGWYVQQDMDSQIEKAESRLQLMRDIDSREKQIAADWKVIDQKNKLLAELGQASRGGQGLLVRLGQGLEDDVWITGIKTLDDGAFSIQGRGALYGHISAMLDRLNSTQSDGDNPMTLENADMAPDGRIDFRIRGRV